MTMHLWHSTFQLPDDAASNARRFAPDEVYTRKLQTPTLGEASGYCDTCGQRVSLTVLHFNEQRWNTEQSAECSACRKYGAPQDRQPVTESKHTYELDWYKSRSRLGGCQVCGDSSVELAETFSLPAWLLKKHKYHVCRECAALALEV
jgi:hypothetical protein